MRILIDLQACQTASRRRGIGRYSLALAESMARICDGHALSLLLNANFPEAVEWLREHFRSAIPADRIHVLPVPAAVAGIDPDNRWRAHAAEAIAGAFVAAQHPDVVLTSSLFEGFIDDAATSLAPKRDYAAAITLYDLIPLLRPELLATPAARSWYAHKLSTLRRADLLLAISEHARREALEAATIPSEQIAVISTAADACFRPLALGDGQTRALLARHGIARPFVLYAGGFDARKNVPRLVASYAALPHQLRDRHDLVLAGTIDHAERRALQRTAERGGAVAGHVRFIGYVDDADLAALYNLCTVFVFPSLHEGFGLPVLEAMSCGAAVIASDASSIPEVLARADARFDPKDAHALTRKLDDVLSNAAFRADLARYGRQRAAAFSWDRTARCALDALVQAGERCSASRVASAGAPAVITSPGAVTVPTLAFVSPLPPERTGVAFYSAELLEPLAAHYRVELVTDQKTVELPPGTMDLPVRSVEWFDGHARRYDRILYQLGNSPFHQRMFGLIDRHPGTAVLHDLHLGGVLNWMEQYGVAPGIFSRWLFSSHGYPGIVADRNGGREAAIDDYPCSWPAIDCALGVIVHSAHAFQLAQRWFRVDAADWERIPQLRRLPDLEERGAARRSLGLDPSDRLFCSFGFLDATKLDDRIVDAWLASPLAADPSCRLVFVGENHGGDYGRALSRKIAIAGSQIRITGYADGATFDTYLLAADAAVQLRGVTRGETSRTALDCLAHGLPLVVNASGSLAELPGDATIKLAADFADADLAGAMTTLARDGALRDRLRERARSHIAEQHDPVRIAAAYRNAIERFARRGRRARYAQAVRTIATSDASPPARPADWRAAAQSIAVALCRPAARQILVDVSILTRQDLRTGIERVVRAVLRELFERTPAGWRVEPVMAAAECYRYARRFTAEWLGVAASHEDAPIEVAAGDVFLGLDWAANVVPDQELVLARYRTLGMSIVFVVYDLLPILRPDWYPEGIHAMHATWLSAVARVADGALCISSAVASELVTWLESHGPHRNSALRLAVLPLGSDLERSVPTRGLPADAAVYRTEFARRASVLMVGTVEPRKGHAQALTAFEQLWQEGVDINLVVVGRQGWMVDGLASRLRAHPETGHRLFWFESASDEWLGALYADADVLLSASLGEGFGLPLIEAARHGLPLLVRDLPVFREVAAEHAMYFSGTAPEDIARAVVAWLHAHETGNAPHSSAMPARDWRTSVDRLLAVICEGQWECEWRPRDGQRASDEPIVARQIDFSQTWLSPVVREIRGVSGREHWGRWSDADVHPYVEIRFRDPLPASGSLALTARAFGPNVGQPVRVRIGRHETELRFDAHDTTVVASYALGQAPQSLEIVPPHPTQPRALGASEDPRRLGIGLVRLTIRASAPGDAVVQ